MPLERAALGVANNYSCVVARSFSLRLPTLCRCVHLRSLAFACVLSAARALCVIETASCATSFFLLGHPICAMNGGCVLYAMRTHFCSVFQKSTASIIIGIGCKSTSSVCLFGSHVSLFFRLLSLHRFRAGSLRRSRARSVALQPRSYIGHRFARVLLVYALAGVAYTAMTL